MYIIDKEYAGQHQITKKVQIVPGGNKATLTLADGTEIDLNAMNNGLLSRDHGAQIVKGKEGQLYYTSEGEEEQAPAWNTLSVPAGGYYSVTLSDGTVVWLNAKASLKYPTEFVGDSRWLN